MTEEVTGAVEAENPSTEQEATTVLESQDGETEVKPDWPDDWRGKLAGDDEKLAKRLQRFQSPKDIMKSWLAADQKISSGEYKSELPENATGEQLAEYRKARGIPEKPEGYLESLPDGLVIGDEDKELVGKYVERVHGKNADPAIVAESLAWYQDLKEQQITEQVEADRQMAQQYEDELRAEWGNEFRANTNTIKNFLDSAGNADDGTPLKDLMLNARLADGTPFGSHPAFLKWVLSQANEANPAGFVAPSGGGSQAESVAAEIAAIEKTMRTDRKAYNADKGMQERYLKLLEAQQKLAG